MERGPMRRIAVFGNAGGGKSTLARRLAQITGLPLAVLDMMQWRDGGVPVPHAEFLAAHAALIAEDAWIVDGYGTAETAWQRFARADTLVHVDLPLATHAWWVTKRLAKGLVAPVPGWPKGSPLWASSLSSYKVLWACHRHMTPRYRALGAEMAASKRVHRLRSPGEIAAFLDAVGRERAAAAP